MTLSRGMRGQRARLCLLAGGVALLLMLVGGVEQAVAGPPSHAGSSGGPGSSGGGQASTTSDDDRGPAGSAPGRSGEAPGNSGQARSDDQAPGNSGQARSDDQAPGNSGGRRADTTGPPHEPAGSPQGRESPAVESPAEDTTDADEQDTPAPQREPGPANGDDAPFTAGGEAEAGGGGPPPSDHAPPAEPPAPEPTIGLAEPAGVEAPHLEDENEGPVAGAHLFERISRGTSQTVESMFSPTRDFGVPTLLMAALAAYLLFHRRLDRGSLPMTGLAAPHDEGPAHARFEF